MDVQEVKTLQDAYDFYLDLAMMGKSPNTKKWYRRRLGMLLSAIGADKPIDEVTLFDLLEWQSSMERKRYLYDSGDSPHPRERGGLSPHTIHSRIRAVQTFFKWLAENGIIEDSPARKLKKPKLPKRARKGISQENIDFILEEAKTRARSGNVYGLRDYAIFKFLESSGARRGGIANLVISDLDFENPKKHLRRRVTVREKGDEERIVLIDLETMDAIKTWLKKRPRIKDDHVFLGSSPGQPWHALTEVGISQILERYKKRLGLVGRVSPHQWRHRWARRMIQERKMDLSQVSQLMGHKQVQVTSDYYAVFSIDELQDSYDAVMET